MAIDPSIALGFKGVDIGELMARQQNAELRRIQLENERMKMDESRAEKEAYGQIFGGGPNANGSMSLGGAMSHPNLGSLARVNPEAAMKVQQYFNTLDEHSRKREEAKWKAAAPLLVRMRQMPYEQRRAFIQSASPVLMGNGWSSEELSSFDPTDQNVDAISAAAMTVNEVVDSQKMNWHPIGENGSFATDQFGNPVGSGNPFAPQGQPQGHGTPQGGGSLNDVFGALIQQESGGRAGIRGQQTDYGVPLGRTQLLPKTAREMATKLGVPWRPELLTGTSPEASAYQEKLGRAYFDEGLAKYGGDVERALKYYHGGPNENLWGPRTRAYAKSILARVRKTNNPNDVRAKAEAAIRAGADPEKVRQRAAALGVTL